MSEHDDGIEAAARTLVTVELRRLPLALARRSTEHHATLMRELALVDAAQDSATTPGKLLSLSAELRARFAGVGEAQRAYADAVAAAGADTADLRYEIPFELAEGVAQVATLLDEVDVFCAAGELVSLVTPPDIAAYRRWVFDQVCSQIRSGARPTPWEPPGPGAVDETSDDARRRATIVIAEDLDLEGAARVRNVISEQLELGATDLEIDVRTCEFIDSTGISLLLTTMNRLRDSGGSLVVVNASESVRRTLGYAGVLDMLVP